ncbi:MAG: hypothetical protein ACK4YQ_12410 [Phenylobacterium sp.]|uniref:hypothetical protein n=1 Tax=Phenylobacterium sp. TaxID=1871053 RepID=UPI00391AAE64
MNVAASRVNVSPKDDPEILQGSVISTTIGAGSSSWRMLAIRPLGENYNSRAA